MERVYAVGLDLDAGDCSAADAVALWRPSLGIIHTTKSSTPTRPRLRIVLLLSRWVTRVEYSAIWRWVAARHRTAGHRLDHKTRDASRLWFLPSLPAQGEPVFLMLAGEPIDVERALAEAGPAGKSERVPHKAHDRHDYDATYEERRRRAAAYLERIPGAVTGESGGTTTFLVAQKIGLGFILDEETTFELMRSIYNLKCRPPWRERDLQRKVREAFEHGRAIRRGQLL